jgi:SAM-dependent methyltransferase
MNDQASTPDQPDFSVRLHELRSAELRRIPPGIRTVLHGGAAAAWYFRWFDENYSDVVERHIGVEAFAQPPADLPDNVKWLQRTLGEMSPVPDGSVDLVFGGQVVEHLWAEDLAGFLLESHRVLRQDGLIVLDSPNRIVTEAIEWLHPEHTAELSVDEITLLLEISGFELVELRGVLLGYDRVAHTFLELEDGRMPWTDRAELAADRPEDSFAWWAMARRMNTKPDEARLHTVAAEQAEAFRARRIQRLSSPLPIQRGTGHVPHVSSSADYAGILLHGPNFPLDAGRWRAFLTLRTEAGGAETTSALGRIEVTSGYGAIEHAGRDVLANELDHLGGWTTIELDFELKRMVMGIELRVVTYGALPIDVQMTVDIRRPEETPVPRGQMTSTEPTYHPEPRTVEILTLLKRRALDKAKHWLPLSGSQS